MVVVDDCKVLLAVVVVVTLDVFNVVPEVDVELLIVVNIVVDGIVVVESKLTVQFAPAKFSGQRHIYPGFVNMQVA